MILVLFMGLSNQPSKAYSIILVTFQIHSTFSICYILDLVHGMDNSV